MPDLDGTQRNILFSATSSARDDLDRLTKQLRAESGGGALPQNLLSLTEAVERLFSEFGNGPQDQPLSLKTEFDVVLRAVLIPYRRRIANTLENHRAALVDPEMLADIDAHLEPFTRLLAEDWFLSARSLRWPRLADFLTGERLASHQPSPALAQRLFDPKHKILLSPSLVYTDLPTLRAQCENRGVPLSVAFLDIDHFKEFNNELTEPIVDRDVLPQLMRLIDSHIYGHGHAYRYGGDEFVVIVPAAPLRLAALLVQGIQAAARDRTYQGTALKTRVSAGLCVTEPDSPFTDRELLERASAAKAFAKEHGRERLAYYCTNWLRSEDLALYEAAV